jgi:hypothetical protein
MTLSAEVGPIKWERERIIASNYRWNVVGKSDHETKVWCNEEPSENPSSEHVSDRERKYVETKKSTRTK